MPRTLERFLAPLALVLGVFCAGAGTYALGHSIGYDQIAYADDPPEAVIGPAGLVLFDAAVADRDTKPANEGQPGATATSAPAISDPTAPPLKVPPLPSDPLDDAGGALSGFQQWLQVYGWGWAVLFGLGSVLIAASVRFPWLRRGRAAILTGTGLAIVATAFAAKVAGATDATVIMLGLNLAFGGGMWLAKPNSATVDLSTATPEQIAAALQASGQPPAALVKVGA